MNRSTYAEAKDGALQSFRVKTIAELFFLETDNVKALLVTCSECDVPWTAPGRDADPVILLMPDGGSVKKVIRTSSSLYIHFEESFCLALIHSEVETHFPGIDHKRLAIEFRVSAIALSGALKIQKIPGIIRVAK